MTGRAVSIGIDLDMQAIHAVKIKHRSVGKNDIPVISAIEEMPGSFVKDDEIIAGLKAIKQRIGVSFSDTVVTCLGGKQTYAAQIAFKKMPDEEMRTALKYEIRKNLPFDTSGAIIEYQYLTHNVKKNDPVPVIVTAVSNIIVQRHLRLFEKAGFRPDIIDVFPLTIANAFHIHSEHIKESEKNAIMLHIGAEYSTVVIDGASVPFFNRTVYFTASELFGQTRSDQLTPRELDRRIASFTEEIMRSLAYYETTYHAKASNCITVLGNYLVPELLQKIESDTGLPVKHLDLINTIDKNRNNGKFDIALALSMRT